MKETGILTEEIMKKTIVSVLTLLLAVILAVVFLRPGKEDASVQYANVTYDVDYAELNNPAMMEASCRYHLFYVPEEDGGYQPFVGDPMPYYEDGVYYIYYLKEGGDSFHHSVYLATTEDFVHYKEYDAPVLEAEEGKQDAWIGTGSLVKIKDTYYLFYTGHSNGNTEYKETIMAAKGDTPFAFEKIEGWEIVPPPEIKQKTDFRDPQVYYDAEKDLMDITVTASVSGVAKLHHFTLSPDLSEAVYQGEILADPLEAFWNLECSDTFRLGGRWYITYSGQDDTLWYASSDQRYGPYDVPRRIDDKLFYAAKHVEDGSGHSYMVGWLRRSDTPFSTDEVSAWAGNLMVQELHAAADGSLYLSVPDGIRNLFADRRPLLSRSTVTFKEADAMKQSELTAAYERYMITGSFTYTSGGEFGLIIHSDGTQEEQKLIAVSPSDSYIRFDLSGGDVPITGTQAELKEGETYTFTYIQEGSCGAFYVDGISSLAVRVYGTGGKKVSLYADHAAVTFNDLAVYTAGIE